MDCDAIVVGAGLAGLVAANELVQAGRRVAVVDQENAANLGGQAFWSFGGLFLVDSPEQRRLGVRDSFDLAWSDWRGSAGWDRLDGDLAEDEWAARWGRAYVEFAAGEKRDWLRRHGIRLTPMVGWAERGDGRAQGHGNSVPRFHVPWGTGTGVSGPFAARALEAQTQGRLTFHFRSRVDQLIVEAGRVTGVSGVSLAPSEAPRGAASSREVVGDFTLRAPSVLIATGGIGGNHDKVRRFWPERLGRPPRTMVTGVPAYVDGRGLDIAEAAGARLSIIEKEFALSGSEQNGDITSGDWLRVLKTRLGKGASPEVEAFKARGADFVVARDLETLVAGMNALTPTPLLKAEAVRRVVEARDAQMANPFAKDLQVQGVHNARRYLGDRLARVAKPHRLLDPAAGPLIGVKLSVLTRKSLGGVQTDLDSRVLRADGTVLEGLYAAGEAAGFGGGGAHGYNALEGTFLGGCLFTGRAAGRAMAERAG